MNELLLPNYNLSTTLIGGQAFNWDLIGDSYYGFTTDKVIKLKQVGSKLFWQTFPEKDNLDFLKEYLQLDIDYDKILSQINKDHHISKAINQIPHIRLLKQDLDQTLLSFILTSHKNIKAVRKVVRDLSKKYGKKLEVDGIEFSLFPQKEVLAEAEEKELREAGTGFRANYLKEAAVKLSEKPTNIDFSGKTENEAREILLSFKGIGDKIADCILVFSLGYYTVTPLDIWGKRVLTDLYKVNPKLNYSMMRSWYREYFGENTAWAGQFLFEYLRVNYNKLIKTE